MATVQDHPQTVSAVKHEAFVEQQLARARGRIRAYDLTAAGLGLAIGTLAYGLIVILLDSWLELPSGVRQAAFLLYGAAALVFVGVALVWPLCQRVNPYFAARKVEEVVPGAKNSLVNWLDLRAEPLPPAIRQAVGVRAARDLARTDLDRAISGRSVLWMAAVAGGFLLATVVLFTILRPAPFFSHLERVFTPFSRAAIATKTRLIVVQPEGGDATVPINQSVSVTVNVEGKVPDPDKADAIKLLFRYNPGDPVWEEKYFERGNHDREWLTRVPAAQVLNGFWYKVTGGDGETPEYRIQVRSRPLLTGFDVAYKFRRYVARLDETRHDPNLEGPPGTRVSLVAHTNRVVKEGRLQIDGVPQPVRGKPAPGQPNALLFEEFVLDKDGTYRIHFTSDEGEENAEQAPYTIKVQPDAKPVVELTMPGADIELPANGVLQLEGKAIDDFGVKGMTLQMRVQEGPALQAKPYRPGKSFEFPDGTYPLFLDYKDHVELDGVKNDKGKPFSLRAGMVLEYWLEATDSCDYPAPNVGRTEQTYRVKLTEPVKDPVKKQEQTDQAKEEQKKHEAKQDEQLKQEQQKKEERAKGQEKGGQPEPAADPETKKKNEELERQREELEKLVRQKKQEPGAAKQEPPPEPKGADKPQPKDPSDKPNQTEQPTKPEAGTAETGDKKYAPKEDAQPGDEKARKDEGQGQTEAGNEKSGKPEGDKDKEGKGKSDPVDKGEAKEGNSKPRPELKEGQREPPDPDKRLEQKGADKPPNKGESEQGTGKERPEQTDQAKQKPEAGEPKGKGETKDGGPGGERKSEDKPDPNEPGTGEKNEGSVPSKKREPGEAGGGNPGEKKEQPNPDAKPGDEKAQSNAKGNQAGEKKENPDQGDAKGEAGKDKPKPEGTDKGESNKGNGKPRPEQKQGGKEGPPKTGDADNRQGAKGEKKPPAEKGREGNPAEGKHNPERADDGPGKPAPGTPKGDPKKEGPRNQGQDKPDGKDAGSAPDKGDDKPDPMEPGRGDRPAGTEPADKQNPDKGKRNEGQNDMKDRGPGSPSKENDNADRDKPVPPEGAPKQPPQAGDKPCNCKGGGSANPKGGGNGQAKSGGQPKGSDNQKPPAAGDAKADKETPKGQEKGPGQAAGGEKGQEKADGSPGANDQPPGEGKPEGDKSEGNNPSARGEKKDNGNKPGQGTGADKEPDDQAKGPKPQNADGAGDPKSPPQGKSNQQGDAKDGQRGSAKDASEPKEPGEPSGQKGQPGGKEGEKGQNDGRPGQPKRPDKNQMRSATPTGSQQGENEGPIAPAKPEESAKDDGFQADPRHARRATDLTLEELKKKMTPDMLKKAGMTEADFQKFLKGYEEMLKRQKSRARPQETLKANQAGQKLPDQGARRVQSGTTDKPENLNQGGPALAPPEFRQAYREFSRELAKRKKPAEKK